MSSANTPPMSRIAGPAGRTAAALFLVLATATSGFAQANGDGEGAKLTLDRLYSMPSLIGTAPRGFAWSGDGRSLAFLWNDEGRNFRDVWVVDAEDPDAAPRRVTALPQMDVVPDDPQDPISVAEAETRAEGDGGVSSVIWHPDGDQVLLSFRGDLWLVPVGGASTQISDTEWRVRPAGQHGASRASPHTPPMERPWRSCAEAMYGRFPRTG